MVQVKRAAQSCLRGVWGVPRKAVSLIACVLFLGTSSLNAQTEAVDEFKTNESYVADGQVISVSQVTDEVTIRFESTDVPTERAKKWAEEQGKAIETLRTVPQHSALVRLRGNDEEEKGKTAAELRLNPGVEWVYPVYRNANGLRLFLNDEINVQTKQRLEPANLLELRELGLELVELLSGSDNIYTLKLLEPKLRNPFKVCDILLERMWILWAEPNLSSEINQHVTAPNDTHFNAHWNHKNTTVFPQTPSVADADVDSDNAWDFGFGSPGIRIAILDDGIEASHEDLDANVASGYDFYNSDSDPSHSLGEYHGTCVAGIAGAEINNSTGVSGVAGKSKILPVKIFQDGVVTTASSVYKALVYAADNADVLNCSWGGGAVSSTITSGFGYAASSGRAGKGCAVLCASGNFASGEGDDSYENLEPYDIYAEIGAGKYYLEFQYIKDGADVDGDDAVWLAEVAVPKDGLVGGGYYVYTFNTTAEFAEWTTSGSANWTQSIDAEYSHGTSQYAVRSGAIGHNQVSSFRSPLLDITSTQPAIFFRRWMSSHPGDVLKVRVLHKDTLAELDAITLPGNQVANRATSVAYPANLTYALAVGGSTDFDYRSDYSQYGSTLDLVAPTTGGFASPNSLFGSSGVYVAGIPTTYPGGNVYVYFDGTSASSPMAAGVAALVLSRNGNQSKATVLSKLTQNCDKVGPLTYTGTAPLTRNDYYGHGRINAYAAVNATTADTTAPTFSSASVANYRAVDVLFNEPMGEGAETPGNYTITAGQNTLSSNPSRVLRLTHSIYRLIWTSGEIAASGTVTIQAAAGIKDVAGNSLGANTSRSSTGTKRFVGVQCGNIPNSPGYLYFGPYHLDTLEFQGNEYVGKTSGSDFNSNYTYNSIDTSWVTDAAPQAVYQSYRRSYSGVTLTYVIPNISAGNKNIRLHFAEHTYSAYGDQVFDVKVNGVTKLTNLDIYLMAGGVQNKAVTRTISSVAPDVNGKFTIELVPVTSTYGTAAVNGIEVLNP